MPSLRPLLGDGIAFELMTSFRAMIDGRVFDIPKGFRTDLASVPRVFQNIINNDDPDILRPSIVHDWIYQHHMWGKKFVTREWADAVLREGMAFCGAGWLRRWTVWSGVRIGGGSIWASHVQRSGNLRCLPFA